mgnify:CR=1 FL=1
MVARPFFMTLPGYPGRMDEKEILNDLEYLQQTYPGEVRRCQRRIAEILDKYDYEGSMIYDEYPDRLRLYRLAMDILDRVKREENSNEESAPDADSPEKWQRIGDLIQILLFYEIYKRRHRDERFTHLFI